MEAAVPSQVDCYQDAMALLCQHNLEPARVVDVHVDAILWIHETGGLRTTFVEVEDKAGRIERRLTTRTGFVAAPGPES